MKKLMLMAAVAVFGVLNVNAQDFKVGANLGMPIGDSGDVASLSIILDVAHYWEVSEKFDVGIASGYSHSLGEDQEYSFGGVTIKSEAEDFGFIPVAGAARFNVSEDFTLGADLGYAIGISPDGNDGGFYYAPRVQYGVSESLDIVLAYRGVSLDGGSFDILSLGVEFGL